MSIGKKVNEILHNTKVKTIGTIVVGVTAASLISGCATQHNGSLEFSFLSGRLGSRTQNTMGKEGEAPKPDQAIFNSDSQVQPYAVETFRHYPATSSTGMKDAYRRK